jgi:hypothetical protein
MPTRVLYYRNLLSQGVAVTNLTNLLFHVLLGCIAVLACLFQEQQDLSPSEVSGVDTAGASAPQAVSSKLTSMKAYETLPIDFITVTCRAQSTSLRVPPAPSGWVGLSDVTQAFSLVYDPTTCSPPSVYFSSFRAVGASIIGFEARRLIAGYRGDYPGTQHPESFEDIEKLKNSFLEKLKQDDSVSANTREGIVADIEQRLAKAKSEHDRRLVIASELDPRLTAHTDDELIVKWDQGNLKIGDQLLASAQLITEIQNRNIHHLMLKIPPSSNVSFSYIEELVNSIRQNVRHVKLVEVRLD